MSDDVAGALARLELRMLEIQTRLEPMADEVAIFGEHRFYDHAQTRKTILRRTAIRPELADFQQAQLQEEAKPLLVTFEMVKAAAKAMEPYGYSDYSDKYDSETFDYAKDAVLAFCRAANIKYELSSCVTSKSGHWSW